jgi:hypothetical protein
MELNEDGQSSFYTGHQQYLILLRLFGLCQATSMENIIQLFQHIFLIYLRVCNSDPHSNVGITITL